MKLILISFWKSIKTEKRNCIYISLLPEYKDVLEMQIYVVISAIQYSLRKITQNCNYHNTCKCNLAQCTWVYKRTEGSISILCKHSFIIEIEIIQNL